MTTELLLRGAFLDDGEALDAWQAWTAHTSLAAADPESFGLLPLLHRKLEAAGADHPDLGRLKGMRRRIWLENQMALREADGRLAILEAAGINTLVLGGFAMLDGYYHDAGLRPVGLLEVLVRADDRVRAAALLGSTPRTRLHRRPLFLGCSREVARAWWDAAAPLRTFAAAALALCPADQLLHVLVNGARWRRMPSSAWMADALAILADGRVDTVRVADHARELRIAPFVRKALERLSAALGRAVAPELEERLRDVREWRADRLEYAYYARRRANRPLRSWPVAAYRRLCRDRA